MLFANLLIENNAKEILTSKLNKSSKDIKYNYSKLATKVNKKELKYINKGKDASRLIVGSSFDSNY